MNNPHDRPVKSPRSTEQMISAVLITGRYIIIGCYLSGIAVFLVHRDTIPRAQNEYFHSLRHLFICACHLDARAFFYLGTLAAILTPLTNVFVLLFTFARERNKKFTVVASLVSLIVIVSVAVGLLFHIR